MLQNSRHFDEPVLFDPEQYEVVFSPPCHKKGCWAGAPSISKDQDGNLWLAHRRRNPEKRGFEIVISKSTNGVDFEPVNSIRKDQLGVQSLERPVLYRSPRDNQFHLYLSADPSYFGWHILKLEAVGHPSKLSAHNSEIVFAPDANSQDRVGVKDPYILTVGRRLHMFYIGWDENGENAYLARSVDGKVWQRYEDNPVLTRSKWHSGLTRISCVMPMERGYMVYYEGTERDRFFDLRTGLAYSTDLKTFTDVTPNEPVLESSTGNELSTLRYLDYVVQKNHLLFYYEAARDDDALELRMSRAAL